MHEVIKWVKDIVKIEGFLDIDLDVLGVLDHDITINIIRDGKKLKNILQVYQKGLQTSFIVKIQDV